MCLKYYRLDENKNVVLCADEKEMAGVWGSKDRIVKQEDIGRYFISTVFLPLDHRVGGEGPPVVFETMIFNQKNKKKRSIGEEVYQRRCCTWQEAEAMHAEAVKWLRKNKRIKA